VRRREKEDKRRGDERRGEDRGGKRNAVGMMNT
jgi:hypothetical protein